MNVFEDLIVELKEENLLERTVIDEESATPIDTNQNDEPGGRLHEFDEEFVIADRQTIENRDIKESEDAGKSGVREIEYSQDDLSGPDTPLTSFSASTPEAKAKNSKEFFKKRAMSEVSSLQMVEHVLTGVEREYMKVLPNVFDDFKAKKALNYFLQSLESESPSGHADAEFAMMQETETWCSALAARDAKISVSSLRLYCENTKPALSSQALLSVARFYRNLPYSEVVRAKFDFVITRLFSRPVEDERRACLFNRNEMLAHINTLYSDWASVPLYSADDDESNIMLTALSFEDLAVEAENASAFDQLVASDFFGRLRLFKESISEIFLAPQVTAAAIESNVRIGNVYVKLIALERQKMDAETIQNKYLDVDNKDVSDGTGRTFDLANLLKRTPPPVAEEPPKDEIEQGEISEAEKAPKPEPVDETPIEKTSGALLSRVVSMVLGINRWLLAISLLLIAISIGIAVWSNAADEEIPTSGVAALDLGNDSMQPFAKTAKISSGILYVQLLGSWDALSKEKRLDILKELYETGADKGFTEVNLVSKDGKMVGYASATRLEVEMP